MKHQEAIFAAFNKLSILLFVWQFQMLKVLCGLKTIFCSTIIYQFIPEFITKMTTVIGLQL